MSLPHPLGSPSRAPSFTADPARVSQEVLSRTPRQPPQNRAPRCSRRLRRPPALTYHCAHHVALHPEAEWRFAAAGGGGGTRWLSPAAGSPSAAADPAPPVRFLRRRPTGAAGPRRASPGSNARGGSVGCGFPPRHGSQESRASHVARRPPSPTPLLCSTGRGVEEALLPPASSPATPRRAHWSPRLRGGACPAWPIRARSHAAAWTCKAPGVTQPEDFAPWSLGHYLNRALKFTFKPE